MNSLFSKTDLRIFCLCRDLERMAGKLTSEEYNFIIAVATKFPKGEALDTMEIEKVETLALRTGHPSTLPLIDDHHHEGRPMLFNPY